MDACHLLLGRPWQYDRDAIHKGRDNTYSFITNGRTVTLLPSKSQCETDVSDSVETPPPPKSLNFLPKAAFEDELTRSAMVLALVTVPFLSSSSTTVPEAFSDLLHQFQDVFPTDLPQGLPPLIDIQHHIDLVLNAVLPNWPHYRMSPQEHDELRRQVELLAKVHVRESLSPTTVPALLIPKKDGPWRMCADRP